MAVFYTQTFTGQKNVPQPDCAELEWVPVDVEFPSTSLGSGDFIYLCRLPAGVKVVDWACVFPDIDSGGSPAFAFTLGVMAADLSDIGTAYATGLTAGQSTTVVRNTTSVAAQASTATERVLAIKVTTAAATYAGSGAVGQILLGLAA